MISLAGELNRCWAKGRGVSARRRRRGGFALIVVLFLVILLAVTVGGYSMRISTAHQAARARAGSWKLFFAARSAVEDAKARLWRQVYGTEETGEWDNPQGGGGARDGGQRALRRAPEAEITSFEGVEVKVWYEDEAGKLPVNDFAGGHAKRSKDLAQVLARLFEKLDLRSSTSLAVAVRDYIDPDGDGRYERGAKNSELFHISELVAARGFDLETLYFAQSDDLPAAVDCLSEWHRGAVNVNSATGEVLFALAPRLTTAEINGIIAARAKGPFESTEDLTRRVDIAGDAAVQLSESIGFSTDTLTLYVQARSGGFLRRVKAVIWIEPEAAHTMYFAQGWDY